MNISGRLGNRGWPSPPGALEIADILQFYHCEARKLRIHLLSHIPFGTNSQHFPLPLSWHCTGTSGIARRAAVGPSQSIYQLCNLGQVTMHEC